MAKISQRSLVEMMRIASAFGLFEITFTGQQALVSPTEMRRFLFGRDFSTSDIEEFNRMQWDFDVILPAMADGTFGLSRNLTWRDRAERTSANLEVCENSLLSLASAFLMKALELNQKSVYGPRIRSNDLYDSLKKDGYIWSADRLVAEAQVIDVPKQLTEFERVLSASKHDDKQLVLHHLLEAEKYSAGAHWGAAASEWRQVFEESLRGAWRYTKVANPAFAGRVIKPPFADVLLWLEQAGFINVEEKSAFGAGFGFLSVGNHPGIKGEHLAYLSRTLALPLAHACLLKLLTWNGFSFEDKDHGKSFF